MTGPTSRPTAEKTVAGCILGAGCLVFILVVWFVLTGLAALTVLHII